MQPVPNRRDRRRIALLAAPAFALALAACGGGDAVSSTDAASAPAVVEQTTDAPSTSSDASESTAESTTTADSSTSETDASTSSEAEPAATSGAQIQLLSADEAIANAELNQPNLQSADNVLDIETLAVGDGSIQTLRNVVDGDRPVLLWFFSPH